MKKWILITCSALLFSASFIAPAWLDWGIFLFLIPLFYAGIQYRCSWREGFGWGVLVFSIQFLGIGTVLYGQAAGPFRLAAYVILVTYCAGYASAWFGITAILLPYGKSSLLRQGVVWTITAWAYFYVIHELSLSIFGLVHGYHMSYPLVPLAQHPQWLAALSLVPAHLLLLWLIGGAAGVTLYAIEGGRWFLVIPLWLVPFLIGWTMHDAARFPSYVETIGYVHPISGDHDWPQQIAQDITNKIFELRQRYPELSLILMPESSCKFALNTYPAILRTWRDNVLQDDCVLVLGSHCENKNLLFNSLYCVQKGLIINRYDKTTRIPFGEYIPFPWSKIPHLSDLFLSNKRTFSAGDRCSPVLPITASFSCIPFICYDLYSASTDPGQCAHVAQYIPVLAAVNDSWYFETPFFQHLLFLSARLKAMSWRRPLVYVAHTGAWWISRSGAVKSLKGV